MFGRDKEQLVELNPTDHPVGTKFLGRYPNGGVIQYEVAGWSPRGLVCIKRDGHAGTYWPTSAPPVVDVLTVPKSFQARVGEWMLACFGAEIAADTAERNCRFIEEALELVQACGMSKEDVLKLVDYTFSRPNGEIRQEVGGVMVTLAALCGAHSGLFMTRCGEDELARVWGKVEQIREKQRTKPKASPLPQ